MSDYVGKEASNRRETAPPPRPTTYISSYTQPFVLSTCPKPFAAGARAYREDKPSSSPLQQLHGSCGQLPDAAANSTRRYEALYSTAKKNILVFNLYLEGGLKKRLFVADFMTKRY